MDLSPGGSTPPVTALAGCIVSFFTRKFYHPFASALALALNHPLAPLPSPATFVIPPACRRQDRSRPASLLFCFAPAKQPACEVEGSLFRFLPTQNKNGPDFFSEPFLNTRFVSQTTKIKVDDKAKIPAQT
jgi:hypothetical protein